MIYVTATTDGRDCGDGISTETRVVDVTSQSGNSIDVLINGSSFTGNFSGNSLTWNGSYPEDLGTTTESISLTVDASCNSFSGSSTWSWTDGSFTCSGTADPIDGLRNSPAGCGSGGTTTPEGESNDTPAEAQIITLPVTIAGNISGTTAGIDYSGDQDYFSFTVTSTQTVTATLTGGTTTDMDLFFVTADGMTGIDLSTGLDSNESLTGNFLAGTYLVLVAPWDVPVVTSYTLDIR